MKHRTITSAQSATLLAFIYKADLDKAFLPDKNQWIFYQGQETVLKFRIPITIEMGEKGSYLGEGDINYVLLMIRSGIASLGYFEGGDNLDHKVFRAYMVRKKQGTSQIKHLKTKGKSRAGSRVRLAETLEFFEDINFRMKEYFSVHRIDKICISCSTTLIPYLFGSKTETPFDKSDPRIMKIPKHVQNPTYESLLEVNDYLKKGELRSSDAGDQLFDQFIEQLSVQPDMDMDKDDW